MHLTIDETVPTVVQIDVICLDVDIVLFKNTKNTEREKKRERDDI